MNWHALAAATLATLPRVPFAIAGRRVGSVACAHLAALRAFGGRLAVRDDGVDLIAGDAETSFAQINGSLRDQGLIRAWRDETYLVVDPETLLPLARMERAASRFWGTLTFGAHATGYVAGPDGRPAQLWIAQRAFDKATDPGLFDNLIGGGVPAGQTPDETLQREAWEEAGLQPAQLSGARRGSVLRLERDIAEGFQFEWLHSYDLELPAGTVPVNQDGEVAAFTLMPLADALALAAGPDMTVDAAVVTLDFALRQRLLDAPEVERCVQTLRVARM